MGEMNWPGGWTTKVAAECFDQVSTTGIKVKTKDCKESGLYPVIDQGRELISGFIDDNEKLIKLNKPVIVFGDHTRNIKWVDFDFVPGADGTKILSPKGYLLPRVAFYELKNLEIPDKGYSRHFKFLKELEIPIPPLAEQKIIADKLDTLLAQVETTKARLERIPEILKTFRQSVLAAAVSGKLTEEWRGRPDSSKWQSIKLNKIVEKIEAGKNLKCIERPPQKNEFGIIKISAVTWGFYDEEQSKTLPDKTYFQESRRIAVGDFLISRANTIELLGSPVIVHEVTRNLMLSDKVLRLIMNEEDKPWVSIFLRSKYGRKEIEARSTGNQMSMRNIGQKALMDIDLPKPSLREQAVIVRRVEENFVFADRIEHKANVALERVNKLTQSILAKAFRGELTADWRAANADLINGENSAESLLKKITTEQKKLLASKPRRRKRCDG